MALFFDQTWFDARLAALGLSRQDFGRVLGLGAEEVEALWKDQREITAREVALMAALLAVPPAEIAQRAGVSTPVPSEPGAAAPLMTEVRLAALEERIAGLERGLDAVTTLVRRMLERTDASFPTAE